ncbi:MAG: glycosyltransferase [Chloroflexi bacterium]|jgi:glycosyltransferase involved in cell wall biosynthesis|nr:glycosyltransferase [Chloroflexota bacterium]
MPQQMPLVSVVTPSYNQAQYLEQTMLSVLDQDYPHIEYWVMDGGSSDGSVDIIKKHASRLAGWVSEKDKGQADAVNKGFSRASGDIVGWLNSDDLYYPGAIAGAVKAFQDHPEASIVFSDVNSIDDEGIAFNRMRFGDWKLEDLMRFNIISQPGVFMRRSVLEKAGYLGLDYHFLLDVELWLRMAAIAEPFYVPDVVWSAARMHADAKNRAQALNFGPEAFRIAKWLCEDERFYPLSARIFKQIWAGAYRIDAFYRVEAEDYRGALKSYREMLKLQPIQAPKAYARLVKSLINIMGFKNLGKTYEHLREKIGKKRLRE